jgi:dipeptidyl-peptidase-4
VTKKVVGICAFFVKTAKGNELNAWMIKPKDFDPTKNILFFMYQYSGPGSQQVNNRWNSTDDYWFMMLSQQGYIVLVLTVVEPVLKELLLRK